MEKKVIYKPTVKAFTLDERKSLKPYSNKPKAKPTKKEKK